MALDIDFVAVFVADDTIVADYFAFSSRSHLTILVLYIFVFVLLLCSFIFSHVCFRMVIRNCSVCLLLRFFGVGFFFSLALFFHSVSVFRFSFIYDEFVRDCGCFPFPLILYFCVFVHCIHIWEFSLYEFYAERKTNR